MKLHLRLLQGDQKVIGWAKIAALALVCGNIEQVQSELRHSTTEMLSLARRNLAGRGDRGDEEKDEGGDTETEDEEDEIDVVHIKVEPRREETINEEMEQKVVVKEENVITDGGQNVSNEASEAGDLEEIHELETEAAGEEEPTDGEADVMLDSAVKGEESTTGTQGVMKEAVYVEKGGTLLEVTKTREMIMSVLPNQRKRKLWLTSQ